MRFHAVHHPTSIYFHTFEFHTFIVDANY